MDRKFLIIFILAIFCLTFLISCSQPSDSNSSVQNGNTPQWSKELEYEIKEAYYKQIVGGSDFSVGKVSLLYYGSYSGYEAVKNNGLGDAMVVVAECGGHTFRFGTSDMILMYKDGVFISFDDAFKEGKISQGDIDRLYEAFTKRR